jgi:rhamnogalacturonyl hydrolase YesR
MKNKLIVESLNKLLQYIENEKFRGYDPYDYLNSFVPFHWFGKWGQAIPIQIGKLNPINIRPLMGIQKEEVPKGLGILLQTYSVLYEQTNDDNYLYKAEYLFNRILEARSPKKKYYCWGCNFVWANPHSVLPKYMPSGVVTSFVCQGIYKYYLITKDEKALEVLKDAAEYVMNDLPVTETKDGICISYTEVEKSCCYNASILSAEVLAMVYSITGNQDLKKRALDAINFILAHQKDNGLWEYSIDINTGKERSQIDFHQGFILNSLANTVKYANITDIRVNNAIKKGLEYYRKEQFYDNGVSLWRIPKVYPVEIHNQAQGIITFTQFSNYDKEFLAFANTIAEWTIDNMQDKKGYFYYRKFKYYTNKIPYMRWSQAWMALALTNLIASKGARDVFIATSS